MLSYVLFSYVAFDFPIHTLRLLHSLALAFQLTLRTPFASVLTGFSTNSAFNISLSFPALSRTCPENARGQGHAGPFHETIHLKGPTTHWCTRRCRGSRDIVYGSADILGLLSTILHTYIKVKYRLTFYIPAYVSLWILVFCKIFDSSKSLGSHLLLLHKVLTLTVSREPSTTS